jgi:secondary thiamine-phosphate synthase enzyme
VATRLSEVISASPQLVATATLSVDTAGEGLTEITDHVRDFLDRCEAREGVLFLYLRHTSASLLIQENADPDVRSDLITALRRLAPDDAGWVHDTEGPDDMPAHVKAMLTGISPTFRSLAASSRSAPGKESISSSIGGSRIAARSCCNFWVEDIDLLHGRTCCIARRNTQRRPFWRPAKGY